MNKTELNSVHQLKILIETYGVLGIKTSFEDEGASFNEVIRLKELCNQAGTKLLLKVSGAEAKRDLADAQIIGVKGIVAPMIESPFALDKYIKSVQQIIDPAAIENIQLGVNIETFLAYKNFDEISKADGFSQLYNVTFGRVDFVSSMNKDRSYVNSTEMLDIATNIFTKSRELGKKLYVGGAVTTDSEEYLNTLYKHGLLDKFETRYVMYEPAIALKNLSKALLEGQRLELGILRYRKDLYFRESVKEDDRIDMIAKRVGE
jgi:4-hydroxy-2-oxoheptanedioate aldolase